MNFNKTLICVSALLGILVCTNGCSPTPEGRTDVQAMHRPPVIEPDYSGIEIPPNVAPLNFFIKEPGQHYFIKIHSNNGEPIRVQTGTGAVHIPIAAWKELLAQNHGQRLITDIYIQDQSGAWIQFDSTVSRISRDSVDGYLAYRKFDPVYNNFKKMGIYQRDLETFEETPVLLNRQTQDNCMNCHNFCQNRTDRWLLHMRGGPGTSMVLVVDGKAQKIDLKTKFNGPAAYPAWHPSGNSIAFSVSKLRLFFHQIDECRDVLDVASDLIIYDIPTNTVTTTPDISSPERMEIWPAWSPDGKYLYFCSAPKIETYENKEKPGDLAYEKIRYDLMRIGYDSEHRTWGTLETVISADECGFSITEPRVSPDGRFLLFTGAAYSQFPIYLKSADVYLLDLISMQWRKLESNSDEPDSFHSWSSNGRWIVFSSKRQDKIFTQPYFTHIDSLGCASKPFVLPQEEPTFNDKFLKVYNVPEFIKEPIRISPQELAAAAFSTQALTAKLDPNVLLMRSAGNLKLQTPTHVSSPRLTLSK
jgi:hypothetical protein